MPCQFTWGSESFDVLEERSDLEMVQRRFVALADLLEPETTSTAVGFQGGSFRPDVWWVMPFGIGSQLGIPPTSKVDRDRFSDVLGIGRLIRSTRVICEVNSTLEGCNSRIGEAYAVDKARRFAILHRRIVRGHGLTRTLFWQRFACRRTTGVDGLDHREFALILDLDLETAACHLRDFIFEISRVTGLV